MDIPRLIRAALLAAGAELSGLALTGTAAWLLLRAAERPPLAALTVAVLAVRVFALLRGGLRYAERLAGHEVVLRHLAELRTRVYEALLPQRVARHSGADLVTRLVSDVDAVQDAVLRLLLPAGVAMIAGVVVTTVVALASLPAAAAVATGLVVAALLPWPAARLTAAASAAAAPARQELAERAVELSTGRRELIAYGAEPAARAAAGAVADGLAARSRRTSAWMAALTAAGVLVQLATTAAVALLSAASVPVTAALTLSVMALFEVVLPLTAASRRLPEVRASLRRVRAVLGERPTPREDEEPGPGHLRLHDVGVTHPGRPPALAGVSLDLPPGRRLGILGPSGSGKTTLLHVLLAFVEPTSGHVTIDGRPLREHDARVVSGALADAHVFHTTVRENLRLAKPRATDGELLEACATAGFDLPLDRGTGPDGAALSGGQRQRLALARAVLAAPPVLLLDEPVEGLDPEHGDEVLARVLAAAKGTVVLVTHRPGQLAGFDQVLTLADGRPAPRASAAGPAPGSR
ncbi:thiol reductant ABC exporter subunit CydC [Amycolatopsis saalfeldensis]|uniref:thiol reductant ABC exporter subunit CydC n=1 Tax=Amycolatopsis saalfeldensis TaxID=394193 RepID=UPI000B808238|nr:thiol reductant ABC exporter subunit CydC [Amycolatopsis saalfeldensis]